MRRVPGRVIAIGAALLLVISLGVLAWGYFTAGGSGTAAASTGTVQQVTLSPAVPTAQLYPGGQSAVEVTVTNSNPGPVRIESLSLDTTQAENGFAVDADHVGCGLASLSFNRQTNGGAGWDVTGNGSVTISLPGALSMSLDAANACQGAAFTVYLLAGAS